MRAIPKIEFTGEETYAEEIEVWRKHNKAVRQWAHDAEKEYKALSKISDMQEQEIKIKDTALELMAKDFSSANEQIKKLKEDKKRIAKSWKKEEIIWHEQIKELEDALIGMAELDIIITSKTESILNKAKQALKK